MTATAAGALITANAKKLYPKNIPLQYQKIFSILGTVGLAGFGWKIPMDHYTKVNFMIFGVFHRPY